MSQWLVVVLPYIIDLGVSFSPAAHYLVWFSTWPSSMKSLCVMVSLCSISLLTGSTKRFQQDYILRFLFAKSSMMQISTYSDQMISIIGWVQVSVPVFCPFAATFFVGSGVCRLFVSSGPLCTSCCCWFSHYHIKYLLGFFDVVMRFRCNLPGVEVKRECPQRCKWNSRWCNLPTFESLILTVGWVHAVVPRCLPIWAFHSCVLCRYTFEWPTRDDSGLPGCTASDSL